MGKTKIEKEGLTLPRGGVIVLSKKSTKTNGAPVHFLLSTGTISNVVTVKTREVSSIALSGSNMLQERPPLQRRKSAWKKFRDTFRFTTGLKKKTEQTSPRSPGTDEISPSPKEKNIDTNSVSNEVSNVKQNAREVNKSFRSKKSAKRKSKGGKPPPPPPKNVKVSQVTAALANLKPRGSRKLRRSLPRKKEWRKQPAPPPPRRSQADRLAPKFGLSDRVIAVSGSKKGVSGTILRSSQRFSDGWIVRWDDTGKKKVYINSRMRVVKPSSSSSESESSSSDSSDGSDSDSSLPPPPLPPKLPSDSDSSADANESTDDED